VIQERCAVWLGWLRFKDYAGGTTSSLEKHGAYIYHIISYHKTLELLYKTIWENYQFANKYLNGYLIQNYTYLLSAAYAQHVTFSFLRHASQSLLSCPVLSSSFHDQFLLSILLWVKWDTETTYSNKQVRQSRYWLDLPSLSAGGLLHCLIAGQYDSSAKTKVQPQRASWGISLRILHLVPELTCASPIGNGAMGANVRVPPNTQSDLGSQPYSAPVYAFHCREHHSLLHVLSQ
jgi:hypothetical protein